jgi:hypothetical protein
MSEMRLDQRSTKMFSLAQVVTEAPYGLCRGIVCHWYSTSYTYRSRRWSIRSNLRVQVQHRPRLPSPGLLLLGTLTVIVFFTNRTAAVLAKECGHWLGQEGSLESTTRTCALRRHNFEQNVLVSVSTTSAIACDALLTGVVVVSKVIRRRKTRAAIYGHISIVISTRACRY